MTIYLLIYICLKQDAVWFSKWTVALSMALCCFLYTQQLNHSVTCIYGHCLFKLFITLLIRENLWAINKWTTSYVYALLCQHHHALSSISVGIFKTVRDKALIRVGYHMFWYHMFLALLVTKDLSHSPISRISYQQNELIWVRNCFPGIWL